MTAPDHTYQIYLKADRDRVWAAITQPEHTAQYFYGTAIETTLEPGSTHRYLLPTGDAAAEGTIEAVNQGHLLVLTWRALYDPALAAEPAGTVEWTLAPANDDGSVTRVQVRHFNLADSPLTWANVRDGWEAILDGLKTYLETGERLGPVSVPEPDLSDAAADANQRAWHRSLAVTANNTTWALLEPAAAKGPDAVTGDEAFELLGRAYAAAYHWRAFNGADSINAARAAWLCSRAHAVLGDGAASLRLAQQSAAIAAASPDASDFDRFYAVEGQARALACLGETNAATAAKAEAVTLLETMADPQDKEICAADLASEPWFGAGP